MAETIHQSLVQYSNSWKHSLERLIELKSVKYSEPAQCNTSEEVLLQNEHIRGGWKGPGCPWGSNHRGAEAEAAQGARAAWAGGAEQWKGGEAALLTLQGR